MSINDFIQKYSLKTTTSNIETHQFLTSSSLRTVGIYLRDGPCTTDAEVVNLHPTKGTQWVAYINQNYNDSYGCSSL